jgi:hypothetical protein
MVISNKSAGSRQRIIFDFGTDAAQTGRGFYAALFGFD